MVTDLIRLNVKLSLHIKEVHILEKTTTLNSDRRRATHLLYYFITNVQLMSFHYD